MTVTTAPGGTPVVERLPGRRSGPGQPAFAKG